MYWFRAKTYGWGWTPNTWQGWAVTVVWGAGFIAWLVYRVSIKGADAGPLFDLTTVSGAVVLIAVFSFVCWLKGEPLGPWRWGR